MEIKSWRELSRGQRRRKKNKSIKKSTFSESVDVGKNIEALYSNHEPNISEISQVTHSTNKYSMSGKNLQKNKKRNTQGIHSKWFWWVIGSLLLASTVLLVSAFRFAGSPVGDGDVEIGITGPTQVAIGEEAVWIIHYKNTSRIDFTNVRINIKYPDGLKLKSTEPIASNLLNTGWIFDTLKRGQDGEIKIYGQLYGDEGQQKDFSVEFIYQPANFSSDFVQNSNYQVTLGSSQIQLGFSLPESMLPEVEQEISFQIKNISESELSQIKVKLAASNNFSMNNPTPEIAEIVEVADGKEYVWPNRNFLKNQEITFTFKGKFNISSKGLETLKLDIISVTDNGEKILRQEEKRIVILGEEIALSMRINDNDVLNEVKSGELLEYSIDIHNTSGLDLENLIVNIQTNFDLIDWATLKAPIEPEVTSAGIIIFNAENFSALQNVGKGEKINLSFSFNLKNEISATEKFRTYAQVTVGKVGGEEKQDLSFSTAVFSAEVISAIKLRSNALYRDDEGVPIGEGKMPPQVDVKTEFQINFSARATQNFSDLVFSATLPSAVTWEGNQNVEKGILSYNSTSRLVTWQVGNISAENDEISANFMVSITPGTFDVGNIIPLLSANTIFYKVDENDMQIILPALDTNLAGALYDTNKGIVVE